MHELAHQWFGDLVTLAWWDDTWLNEAFATWTEQKLVGEWKPEWNQAVADVLSTERAMADDSLISARAVRQPIQSENDIANAFDTITYEKGAAVIRMFEMWVGPDKFQKGVRLYLARHAWGSATADEFLADIGEGAGANVREPFWTFLKQPGVPLVSLALRCGAGGAALEVKQRRYLPLGSPGAPGESWQIPVCVRYGAGSESGRQCMLLTGQEGRMDLPAKACPAWVAGNAGEVGYYRVDYGGDLLAQALQDGGKRLLPAERAGALGDAGALVRGGELPAAEALGMAAEFAADPNWRVETSAADLAESFSSHLVPDALRPNYQRYIRDAFGARARQLGWTPKPGESDDDRLLRPKLVGRVAQEGEDQALIEEARRLAGLWLKDHAVVEGEAAGAVLDTAAQFGDTALFDAFLSAAKSEKSSRDKQRLISALGLFRDPALVRRALALTLSPAFDPRETMGLLFSPLEYEATRALPLEFVKQHFDELVARLPRGAGSDAGARLPDVGSAFSSQARRDEVEAFFASRIQQFIGGPRRLAQTLEAIEVSTAVAKAQEPSAAKFLKSLP
jgi:alanyl aminopeptidase